MRIPLGHRAPGPLRNNPAGHITDTAPDRHWQELRNGGLLDQAQAGGYELLITADRNLPFQQNFAHRHTRVPIVTTNSRPTLCNIRAKSTRPSTTQARTRSANCTRGSQRQPIPPACKQVLGSPGSNARTGSGRQGDDPVRLWQDPTSDAAVPVPSDPLGGSTLKSKTTWRPPLPHPGQRHPGSRHSGRLYNTPSWMASPLLSGRSYSMPDRRAFPWEASPGNWRFLETPYPGTLAPWPHPGTGRRGDHPTHGPESFPADVPAGQPGRLYFGRTSTPPSPIA